MHEVKVKSLFAVHVCPFFTLLASSNAKWSQEKEKKSKQRSLGNWQRLPVKTTSSNDLVEMVKPDKKI